MIISRGRRYIFVHIPKTGGTSLSLALEARAMADDVLIGDTPKARQRKKRLAALTPAGRLWKHATLADIDGVVDAEDLDAMLCFTLVRNPWDRVVSYFHWLRGQKFEHRAVALAKALTFEEFVLHPHTRHTLEAWPYERYMTDARGHVRADQFLRLEHLAEDLAPLSDHLGFVLQVPHENRSGRDSDYRQYYSSAMQETVARVCARDIARFGYRF